MTEHKLYSSETSAKKCNCDYSVMCNQTQQKNQNIKEMDIMWLQSNGWNFLKQQTSQIFF